MNCESSFRKRNALVVLCACYFLLGAQAQSRNANWLALGTWIAFGSGEATLDPNPPLTNAGAALSDTSGQLKVYVGTNGSQNGLRGPDHTLADNHPDPSLLNGAGELHRTLFVPKPGEPVHAFLVYNQTYFLASVEFNRVGWLEMDLSEDHPAVVSADFTWFANDQARKRSAVPHANGTDYWMIMQSMGINLFNAYRINGNGVDPVPVMSQTGAWPPDGWVFGKMIPNSQGDRFASVTEPANYDWSDTTSAIAEIFQFNQATGEVTFELALPGLRRVNGIEFSPNGRFLYVAEKHTPVGANQPYSRRLYQYDLESSDPVASRLLIHSHSFSTANLTVLNVLALAPDGRIYQAPDLNGTALGIIRRPNELGAACDYVHEDLECQALIYSVPAPVKRYHDDTLAVVNGVSQLEAPHALPVAPNPAHDHIRLMHASVNARAFALRDAAGRAVLVGPLLQGAIDLRGLASGSYVVEVFDAQGARMGVARVIKD